MSSASVSEVSQTDPEYGAVVIQAWQALRPTLIPRSQFTSSVLSVTRRQERYARARYDIAERAFVRKTEPAVGVRKQALEEVKESALDPWDVDPAKLPSDTRQVCTCFECGGTKEVQCSACNAVGRLRCSTCNGSGQVVGQRGPKNCPSCRGRGNVDCPNCTNGMCACATCERTGKVYTWLEITGSPRREVCVDDPNLASRLHPNVADANDFDRSSWSNTLDAQVELDVARVSGLPTSLHPRLDARRDRIMNVRVQQFVANIFELKYGTVFGIGIVEFAGSPLRITHIDRAPLKRRSSRAFLAGLFGIVATLFAVGAYCGRHEWYSHHGAWPAAFGLALIGCAFVTIATFGWTRRTNARTRMSTLTPTLVAIAAAASSTLVLALSRPSIATARNALTTGNLEDAALAANALRATGHRDANLDLLLDDIHLHELREAASLESAAESAARPWNRDASRATATSWLRNEALKYARAARDRGDGPMLGRIAELISNQLPDDARTLRGDASYLVGLSCVSSDDAECAESQWKALHGLGEGEHAIALRDALASLCRTRLQDSVAKAANEQDPSAAVRTLEGAIEIIAMLGRIGVSASEDTTSRIALDLDRAKSAALRVERQEAIRIAREAAAEERRAVLERKRAEAASRREEQREAQRERQYAPLRCCDGTDSPSCICGGSHRGCCSHHGGVCGCSY